MFAGVGAVGRIGRHGISGGAKRPSFSVDFVGSGSLGAGAVFTRASVGTYYNSSGVLVSAAINTPRFDYDPATLQLKGLLLEDASTNIALWSGDFTNAAWQLFNGATKGATVTAPDGTTTGMTVTYTTTASGAIFQSLASFIPGSTFSLYIKAGTSNSCSLQTSGGDQLTVSLTSSWQRFALPITASGAGNFSVRNVGTNAGTINIWGAQVEALPYMSSHIPTTSVSVTRARDSLVYPGAALTGFVAPGGSWFAEFDYFASVSGSRVITHGAIPNNETAMQMDASRQINQYDGAGFISGVLATNPNTINKAVTTWTVGQAKVCTNGSAISSTAAMTTGFSNYATAGIQLMSVGSGISLPGHLRALKYWPRTLSDSEMQAATTLAGPTLSLDFMQPSTLDPRIVFTRASSATYTDASGVVQTAATNAPRWDYDPVTHALRGLLIEEQRANSTFPSVPVLGLQWQVSASIGISGAFAAPDGTSTASLFSATSTVSEARAMANVAGALAPSGTPTTVSVFLKKSPNNAYIQVNSGGILVVPCAYYDLTNGTAVVGADLLGSITDKSVSITPYPNGWYRCSFTFTLPAGSSGVTLYIGPCVTVSATGDNRAYPGVVGQGIYCWGAQVEQGAFPTSYIPTTSVSVTRAQDFVSFPVGSWYASPGGSWLAEYIRNNPPNGSLLRVLRATTAANKVLLFSEDSGAGGQFDGAVLFTSALVPLNGLTKQVSTWAVGQAKATQNGGAVSSSAGLVTGYADLGPVQIFNSGVPTEVMTGYIRRVTYWNRALSDTEMQQVTT